MSRRIRITALATLAFGLGLAGLAYQSWETEGTPYLRSPSKPQQAKPSPVISSGLLQDNTPSQRFPKTTRNPDPASPDHVTEAFLTERLQFLNGALTLTTDQAVRARTILASHLPDRAGLIRAAAAPTEDEAAADLLLRGADALRQLRRPGAFADEISGILTPGQQALWQSSLLKMSQDDAEVVSTRELAAIQARTTLSEDQKNGIFAALHSLALAEQTEPPVTLAEAERDDFQVQRRMEALSAHLPAETVAAARRALDQAAAERWLSPLEPLEVFDGPEP